MAKSKIEWTDVVWNPVTGCNKVSQGCKHCYAETIANRFWATQYPPNEDGSPRRFTDVRLHQERLEEPLRWRKPRRVFVNSMGDLFHEAVARHFIADVWRVMENTPQHVYQVLTKRSERMWHWVTGYALYDKPLPNVWLGVSVENQQAADERIPWLLQTPAAVRFVSCEPLLGPVDLERVQWYSDHPHRVDVLRGGFWSDNYGFVNHSDMPATLDWVIVGGESGPGARPIHPDWARRLRDQCQVAGVPFFFKQWGAWGVKNDVINKPIKKDEFGVLAPDGTWYPGATGWNGRPEDPDTREAYLVRYGKKAAGRLLDGREWNEFPEVTNERV